MNWTLKGAWPITLLAAGFAAWAIIFLLLYGMQAMGCRLGWDRMDLLGAATVQRAIQVGLFVVALAGMVVLFARLRRLTLKPGSDRDTAGHAFLISVSNHAALAAVGAVAFCFAGVFWLTAC